jgi:hypothetical protein
MANDTVRLASRIGIGVLCVAASVALAGAAILLPGARFGQTPASVTVTPAPVAAVDVCPGPLVAVGAAGSAASVSVLEAAAITAGTTEEPASEVLLRGVTGKRQASDSPVAVTVPASAGGAAPGQPAMPALAAAQSGRVNADSIAGLTSAACRPPAADSWIVAGATTLGQTSLLLLANPSPAAVNVTVTLWDLHGPVATQAGTFDVPARAAKVVPLSGLAPDKAALAVRIHASGAGIAAALQQSFVQGLTPRGASLTSPGAVPARRQVIPGVMVRTLKELKAGEAADGYGVDLPAARILNPSDREARVNVGAVGESGTTAGNAYAATIPAGRVAEIPLDGLGDGDYTLTVTSNVPVVAAARTTTQGGTHATGAPDSAGAAHMQDFTWFTAGESLPARTTVAVAAGPAPRVHLVNPGTTRATATLVSGARTVRLDVPAGGAASAPLSPGIYTLSGPSGMMASVGYAAPGQLASYPVTPPAGQDSPIRVYTH